jgi:hypothetical protein
VHLLGEATASPRIGFEAVDPRAREGLNELPRVASIIAADLKEHWSIRAQQRRQLVDRELTVQDARRRAEQGPKPPYCPPEHASDTSIVVMGRTLILTAASDKISRSSPEPLLAKRPGRSQM